MDRGFPNVFFPWVLGTATHMASGSVWGSTCRCPIHGQQQSPSWRHTSNNLAHLRGHSRPLLRPAEQEQPELQIENEYQILSPVFHLALLLPSTVFRFIFLLVRCQCLIWTDGREFDRKTWHFSLELLRPHQKGPFIPSNLLTNCSVGCSVFDELGSQIYHR